MTNHPIAEQDSLEPCPFCNSHMLSDEHGFDHPHKAEGECLLNFASFPWEYAAAWNTRPEADTLSQMRAALVAVRDRCFDRNERNREYDIIAIVEAALASTKIEKDAQPAVECKMPNCSDEAVWMGLCQHHREWVQGR